MKRLGPSEARTELDLQAARIVRALANTRKWTENADATEPEASLIGIVGERGSGKSTLLHRVSALLAADQDFDVLPVLRPEVLSASAESLLLAVVGALTSLHPDATEGVSAERELATLAQRALKSTIFAAGSSVAGLLEASGSLGQFAVDSVSMLGRVTSLHDDLRQYIALFLRATGRKGIVVPIDDLDLLPGSLSSLLFDVRSLASLPNIYPIVCLSWDDLRANLRAELRRTFGSMESSEVDRLVEQQGVKTLRPDRIFEPLQLPRNERLSFVPIGEAESLGDLLTSTFRAIDPSNTHSLSDWFSTSATSTGRTAAFATGWLPSNYRALEHLYYESVVLRRSVQDDPSGLEAAHHLRAFVDAVCRSAGVRGLNLEIQSVERSLSETQISATADWPDYRLGVSATSRWVRIHQASGARVRLRLANRLIGYEIPEDRSTGTDTSSSRREASAGEITGATLAQSLLSTSMFAEPRPSGPLSLTEGSCEFLQSVKVIGLPTNDRLLLLPGTADIVHLDRWFLAWNWMVDHSQSKKSEAPFVRALAALCDATSQIWWEGRPLSDIESSGSVISALERCAELYVRLSRTSQAESDWTTSPDKSYCEWFEMLLPQTFHEALLSEEDLREALAIWQAALATSPTGDQALDRLNDVFENRIESHSTRVGPSVRERIWLFGYRSLARSLGEGLIVALNDFEKEYRERERKGSRGTGAVGESVKRDFEGSGYRYAPEVTEAGVIQSEMITRLLDQLRRT